MPELGIRSTYSQCPFQLRMVAGEGEVISTGSGFFYSASTGTYLVTSWHNISGKDPFSGEFIGKSGRVPEALEVKFATRIGDKHIVEFTPIAKRVPLYVDGKPTWLEHSILGSKCDVVAFSIDKPSFIPEFMHVSANRISSRKIPVLPGSPAFIVGFPRNLSVGFGLPIWKSGFIASEPHYDVQWGGSLSPIGGMDGGVTVPAFFIDALTRNGLSGAPVFARFTGTWDMTDPYKPVDPAAPNFWSRDDIALGETAMQFVGLYGGRAPASEGEAGLGFVWKETALEEICARGEPGKHPHFI